MQNRRAAISSNPQTSLRRKFIFQEQVFLNNATGSNSVHDSFQRVAAGSIQGFTTVARTFEQFRIARIRVYCTPALPTRETGTSVSTFFNNLARLPLNACPSTTIITAADFTDNGVAGANIYGYNNVQFRVPDVDHATKIADYTPRITTSDNSQLVRTTNTFIACEGGETTQWLGFQLRIINTNGALPNSVWSDPLYQQRFLLRYEVDFEFKQPSLNSLLPSADLPAPRPLAEVFREKSVVAPDDDSDGETNVVKQ
jgi:hypothetical protein